MFIYESMASIFGKDIEDNMKCLLTFADKKDPTLLRNISDSGLPSSFRFCYLKFDSSVFFCRNTNSRLEETYEYRYILMRLNVDRDHNIFLWSMA